MHSSLSGSDSRVPSVPATSIAEVNSCCIGRAVFKGRLVAVPVCVCNRIGGARKSGGPALFWGGRVKC
jgi:hypothetical protein